VETICVLIDGTVRRTPVANVDIDTKFLKGKLEAVCMQNPVYDLIIGNTEGVQEIFTEGKLQETQAVTTRQMTANKDKVKTPLKVAREIESIVSTVELVKLQKEDESLQASWAKVGSNDESHKKGEHFVEDAGLLYRT